MTRPTDAIGTALARARHLLFRPFDMKKYVAVAFCMWLSRLGSGTPSTRCSRGAR